MGTGEIPPQIYPASGIPSHSITVAFAHVWVAAAGTSAASATAVSGFSVFFSGADADSGFAARNVTVSDQTASRSGVIVQCQIDNKMVEMCEPASVSKANGLAIVVTALRVHATSCPFYACYVNHLRLLRLRVREGVCGRYRPRRLPRGSATLAKPGNDNGLIEISKQNTVFDHNDRIPLQPIRSRYQMFT